jgi:hypothetical protein
MELTRPQTKLGDGPAPALRDTTRPRRRPRRTRLGRGASARRRAIGAARAPASVVTQQRRADCPYPCTSALRSTSGKPAGVLPLSRGSGTRAPRIGCRGAGPVAEPARPPTRPPRRRRPTSAPCRLAAGNHLSYLRHTRRTASRLPGRARRRPRTVPRISAPLEALGTPTVAPAMSAWRGSGAGARCCLLQRAGAWARARGSLLTRGSAHSPAVLSPRRNMRR